MSGGNEVDGVVGNMGLDARRPPSIDQMPSIDQWNWRIETGQMVSDEAQWAARAAAAEGAADVLQRSLKGIKNVLGSNYFGEGCEEGRRLYDDLSATLGAWSESLADQIDALNTIALGCRKAGATYETVDFDEATSIET